MEPAGSRKPSDHLYWARTQSTTNPVEHKPLDKEAAAALQQSAVAKGAAWNAASTWEEKDISKWARELLSEDLLLSITTEFDLSSADASKLPEMTQGTHGLRCSLKVASVTSVTGDVTHVLSRGKQRVVFELGLKLTLEIEIREAGELKHIVTGTLNIPEITNEELDETKLPSHKLTCDDRPWSSFLGVAAGRMWPNLKLALSALVEQAKQKWL